MRRALQTVHPTFALGCICIKISVIFPDADQMAGTEIVHDAPCPAEMHPLNDENAPRKNVDAPRKTARGAFVSKLVLFAIFGP